MTRIVLAVGNCAYDHAGIERAISERFDAKVIRTPVMLLSDHPEYQQSALAAGTELGFGKGELDLPQTEEKLRRFLA